ncbi:MAG: anthranilate phosphoribosyltransferase [Calditrichaeota bacterium]|nr:MAG: anthranilate phosphoribosyltransferase [Calditrichota bacterium]
MHTLLDNLYRGEHLDFEEIRDLFREIVHGRVDDISLASLLTALKIKGEQAHEIAGAAQALRDSAAAFPRPDYPFADCVGTGGDGHHTINISTTTAIVAAAMGLKIAKHGNRSVSSKSGSADVLRALGVHLDMHPQTARACLDEHNLCFLFAPRYHPGIKHAMNVRTTLKTRTIFNILGPLVNPAFPDIFLAGVYSPALLKPYAEALQLLGVRKAWVVHGAGLDEIGLHGGNSIFEIDGENLVEKTLTAEDFGLPVVPIQDIQGGAPERNAALIADLLRGNGTEAHNAVLAANVAALLCLFEKESDLKQAAARAMDFIKSGAAYPAFKAFAEATHD